MMRRSSMQTESYRLFYMVLIFVTVPVGIGIVYATDLWAPSYQYKGVIHPAAHRDGYVSYIFPGTGGGIGTCQFAPEVASRFSVGSKVLIKKSVLFGRCTLSELPKGWEARIYY